MLEFFAFDLFSFWLNYFLKCQFIIFYGKRETDVVLSITFISEHTHVEFSV